MISVTVITFVTFLFFFKQMTAYEMRISDGSSDVCSSDLNRRLADLPGMIDAFAAIVAGHRGEVTAKVTSAHPLTAEQLKELTANLKSRVGRDEIGRASFRVRVCHYV